MSRWSILLKSEIVTRVSSNLCLAVILDVGRCHSKTKTNDDLPRCDTATECMMLSEKSFRPFSKRSEGMSRFTATLAYTRPFCEFVGVWNILSSVNHVLANLALRLVVKTDVFRMEHLLIVQEKQLLFSLLTFQTLMNQYLNWPPNSPDLNSVNYLI